MTLRRYIVSAAVVLMFSCGNSGDIDPECAAASEAAKLYYTYLIEGKNTEFVSSFIGKDSLPSDYRAALDSNACDFIEVQNERHGGIKGVEVVSAAKDSIQKTIDVFLNICYGDSTQEKIVVPMVKDSDKWKMK